MNKVARWTYKYSKTRADAPPPPLQIPATPYFPWLCLSTWSAITRISIYVAMDLLNWWTFVSNNLKWVSFWQIWWKASSVLPLTKWPKYELHCNPMDDPMIQRHRVHLLSPTSTNNQNENTFRWGIAQIRTQTWQKYYLLFYSNNLSMPFARNKRLTGFRSSNFWLDRATTWVEIRKWSTNEQMNKINIRIYFQDIMRHSQKMLHLSHSNQFEKRSTQHLK